MASLAEKKKARAIAARVAPIMVECEKCGSTKELQRHHPDLDNAPDVVEILCLDCHRAADRLLGKMGGRPKSPYKPERYPQPPQVLPELDIARSPQAKLAVIWHPPGVAGKEWAEAHYDRVFCAFEQATEQDYLRWIKSNTEASSAIVGFAHVEAYLAAAIYAHYSQAELRTIVLTDDRHIDRIKRGEYLGCLSEIPVALKYARFIAYRLAAICSDWEWINAGR